MERKKSGMADENYEEEFDDTSTFENKAALSEVRICLGFEPKVQICLRV